MSAHDERVKEVAAKYGLDARALALGNVRRYPGLTANSVLGEGSRLDLPLAHPQPRPSSAARPRPRPSDRSRLDLAMGTGPRAVRWGGAGAGWGGRAAMVVKDRVAGSKAKGGGAGRPRPSVTHKTITDRGKRHSADRVWRALRGVDASAPLALA